MAGLRHSAGPLFVDVDHFKGATTLSVTRAAIRCWSKLLAACRPVRLAARW